MTLTPVNRAFGARAVRRAGLLDPALPESGRDIHERVLAWIIRRFVDADPVEDLKMPFLNKMRPVPIRVRDQQRQLPLPAPNRRFGRVARRDRIIPDNQ